MVTTIANIIIFSDYNFKPFAKSKAFGSGVYANSTVNAYCIFLTAFSFLYLGPDPDFLLLFPLIQFFFFFVKIVLFLC